MPDHVLAWLSGVLAGVIAIVAVAVATRLRLLPEVIDISIVPTGAGVCSLLFAAYGALRRFPPDRLGRITLFGTLLGGLGAALGLAIVLVVDVLS